MIHNGTTKLHEEQNKPVGETNISIPATYRSSCFSKTYNYRPESSLDKTPGTRSVIYTPYESCC